MSLQKRQSKDSIQAAVFGALLSASIVIGYGLEKENHIDLTNAYGYILFAVLNVLIMFLVKKSWSLADDKLKKVPQKNIDDFDFYRKDEFIKCYLGMALCNFIVLLGVYPGFFVYDAQTEVTEVLTRSFNTHHPLLHVLLLGGSLAFFNKVMGSYNAGIFAYTLVQMLVMTAIFTYALSFMKKHGAGKKLRTITFLFFSLFPTIVMYTLCSSKDGLFSAFLFLTVLLFIRYMEERKTSKEAKYGKMVCASAALMMLFRHNGLYAWIVFAIVYYVIYILTKKGSERKRGLLKVLIIPVIVYFLISNVLSAALSAESGEHQEMLTVPIQQLGRLYSYEKDSFTAKEKAVLNKYISDEGLSHYTERLSDILKLYFDNEAYEQDKTSFWKLWLNKALSHPVSYLNSWFLTSYGYWYPGAVINVYKGNTVFTFTYEDSSYFGYEVEQPGERHSLIPVIDDIYRKLSIEKFQQNIPVVSLLFAPGAYFWACIYLVITASRRDKDLYLLPFLLVFMVWLTVLLGPTYLVRYVVYLWYIIPVLILFAFNNVSAVSEET